MTRCGVLYPPVPGGFADAPFESRSETRLASWQNLGGKASRAVSESLGKVRARGYKCIRIMGISARINMREKFRRSHTGCLGSGFRAAQQKMLRVMSLWHSLALSRTRPRGSPRWLRRVVSRLPRSREVPRKLSSHEALLYRDDDDAVEKKSARCSAGRRCERAFWTSEAAGRKLLRKNFMRDLRRSVDKFLTGK